MSKQFIQALLSAPWGHHITRLSNGDSRVELIAVLGGDVVRVGPDLERVCVEAMTAAAKQEADYAA